MIRGGPRKGEPPAANGFTLLELLLATVLMAAIVGVSFEVYIGSLKSVRRGTAEMERYQAARTILQGIVDDLRAAHLTNGEFGFGLRGADGGEGDLLSDRLELTCTTAVPWRDDPEGFATLPVPPRADFRRITYRVITAEEALAESDDLDVRPTVGLVRDVRTNLTAQEVEIRTEVLSRAVVSLQVQYFDGLDWVDDCDAAGANQMPLAVRVTLAILSGEDDIMGDPDNPPLGDSLAEAYPSARTFTTAVNLPMAFVPEDTNVIFTRPPTP